MKAKTKIRRNKTVRKTIIIIASVLAVLCLSGYLFLNNYINKLHIVHTNTSDLKAAEKNDVDNQTEKEAEASSEAEDNTDTDESGLPDSSAEEIAKLEAEIRKNMEDKSIPIKDDDKVLNILLIGSDTRNQREHGRSDSMILVSINRKTKKIVATSLLRDIYLKIPGKRNNRINAAYSFGGADLLMDTIQKNFKVKIDRYVSVDFMSFVDIIDQVGGVTIDVTPKEAKAINLNLTGDNTLLSSGVQVLNGRQALGYSRLRSVGYCDFERTARQRRVLEQVYNKVKGLNLIQINDLLNKILPGITTNLSEGEIIYQILSLPKYFKYDIDQWSIPEKTSYKDMRIRGMSVLGIDFKENIDKLQNKILSK